jgi:predicted kinase
MREAVYRVLLDRAKAKLEEAPTVVLDATFVKRAGRLQAYDLAKSKGAQPAFVHCCCPASLAASRIENRLRARSVASEARPELLKRQMEEYEAPSLEEPAVSVDTREEITHLLDQVYDGLRQRLFGCPAGSGCA